MIFDRYDIQWVGRCQFQDDTQKSDKVWGWFYYIDPTDPTREQRMQKYAYVFWGPTGKTLSFKKHSNYRYELNNMVAKKERRNYKRIEPVEFNSLWPDLYDVFHNKFIYHLMADNI